MIEDIFVPKDPTTKPMVEQLHTVTYVTSDKETLTKALIEGYDLNKSDWYSPTPEEYALYNDYFGFTGSSWEVCSFYQDGAGANVQIRVIFNPADAALVRHDCNGLIVGGATISFPKTDLRAHEQKMSAAGFRSTIGVKEMDFQSPTGEVYTSAEVIYYAPENCYLLAVKRPEIFVPVGPTDPDTGIGGPAYSARCIADADNILEFLKTVMGYEIRRDVVFPIGERSAMFVPEGSEERFIQAFAPGSSTGYLVLMDHMENTVLSTAPTIGTPSRGIVMWSFRSHNIDEVYERAQKFGIECIQPLGAFNSPCLNSRRTLLMKDPGGFYMEIFEDV